MTSTTIAKALDRLDQKLAIYNKLCELQNLEIEACLRSPANLTQWKANARLLTNAELKVVHHLRLLTAEDAYNALNTLAQASCFQSPLYVGMTAQQTLRARYAQHRDDYERGIEGTFGGRISHAGVSWSDLDFFCQATIFPSGEGAAIETTERAMIELSSPKLNARS